MGMIERLVEGSLRKRVFVVIGVLFLVALGVWSVLSIPIDAFPDVTNIQVEVLSTVPGMSPPEVERFVTYPVEIVMRGLPRLAQVRSISKAGLSVVTIVFEDGVDIYFARQLVLERLIEARERVPAGTEIAMGPVSTAMGEVYQYTLDGNPPAGMGMTEYLTQVRTDPGLDPGTPAQVHTRRQRDQLLRRLHQTVPCHGRPGEAARLRPHARRYRREAPPEQPQRRRQYPGARRTAVSRPGDRPASERRGHRCRRPEDGGGRPRAPERTLPRSRPDRPSARAARSRTGRARSSAAWP